MERAIFADNVRLTSFHLNPLHPKFRCFRAIGGSGVLELPREAFACVDAELNNAYEGLLDIAAAERLFETVIAIAGAFLPEPPPLDRRIATIVRMLDGGKEYSLKDLAAKVRLSANRMTHLFTESIGIPLRSYLLWRKIHRVPILLASGKSFTEVAHECGFTDSAHLATAFQNLYGASPTYFFNSNHVRLLSWLRP